MKYFLAFLLTLSTNAWAWTPGSSILVLDTANNKVIHEFNSTITRPIASITKLMTAIVSLDLYNVEDKIKISQKNFVTVSELLTRLLVRSDNFAAELLAKNHPRGRAAFLEAMNNKAVEFNLKSTYFNDPSGLRSDNVSTAVDVAYLTIQAEKYDFIRSVSPIPQTKQYANTNFQILKDYQNILVSKTGFTTAAGRCLTMLIDYSKTKYAIIILGEPTKYSRESTARNLIQISANKYEYN